MSLLVLVLFAVLRRSVERPCGGSAGLWLGISAGAESVVAQCAAGGGGDGNLRGGFAIFLRNFTTRLWGSGLFLFRYRLLCFLRGCFPGSRFIFRTLLLVGFFRCGCIRFAFLTRCLAVFFQVADHFAHGDRVALLLENLG